MSRTLEESIIVNKKSYYAVLGVSKTASQDEIKAAKRKLALRLHPDKNFNNPKAEEAMKIVLSASETLCDPAKRRVYDNHGEDGVRAHESGVNPDHMGTPYQRRQNQMNAEEFFNSFFGGGIPQRQGRHPGAARHPAQGEPDFNPNVLMALPLLVFLIVAMLMSSNVFDVDTKGRHITSGNLPSFSMVRDDRHDALRRTSQPDYPGFEVDYFISRQYRYLYPSEARQLDLKVMRAHMDHLERRCHAETIKERNGMHTSKESCREYERKRRYRL